MTGYIWPYPTENIKIIITFFSGYYLYATNWRHWSFLEVLIIKIGQCDFVDIIRSLLCVKWKEPEKRLLVTWIKMEHFVLRNFKFHCSGRSRTAGTSRMELFVIIVNRWKPLTIITKSSILDVSAVLDPPLHCTPHMTWRPFWQILLNLGEAKNAWPHLTGGFSLRFILSVVSSYERSVNFFWGYVGDLRIWPLVERKYFGITT